MSPALLVAALLLIPGSRHPIHSSSAEIRAEAGDATATITVRVFADDFPPGTDSVAAAAYLADRFRVLQRDGRQARLSLTHLRVEGPVILAHLTAATPMGLAGARIWHGVLTERFDDQVNLVLVRHGGRSIRLVFTASDAPKPLP